MANKKEAEAVVRDVPADLPDKNVGDGDPQSNLPTVKVTQADMPPPDPLHAGPEALGIPGDVFDPNAALRNKLGYGPGLQDSEAKNPAVWSQEDSKEARDAAADAEVKRAERALARAKARAKAIRAGDPLDREAGGPLE